MARPRRSRLRSELTAGTHRTDILNKIKTLVTASAKAVVFQTDGLRTPGALAGTITVDPAPGSDNIIFHPSSKKSSLVVQDLTYTAKLAGAGGDAITVTYTTGGTAGAEAVSVLSNAITVQIESGVSTATQIKAAFDASSAAIALATVAVTGTGSTAQTSASVASLDGKEKYDSADIRMIKRLRTRKYLIVIKDTANPA